MRVKTIGWNQCCNFYAKYNLNTDIPYHLTKIILLVSCASWLCKKDLKCHLQVCSLFIQLLVVSDIYSFFAVDHVVYFSILQKSTKCVPLLCKITGLDLLLSSIAHIKDCSATTSINLNIILLTVMVLFDCFFCRGYVAGYVVAHLQNISGHLMPYEWFSPWTKMSCPHCHVFYAVFGATQKPPEAKPLNIFHLSNTYLQCVWFSYRV